MSSPLPEGREHICYRCRRTASKNKELISCHYCTLYWHLECIPLPLSTTEKKWTCPRHQKPFDPKKRSSKRSSKSKARMDIIESFEEADEIVKYGGVVHEITEETIENDFLVYAKRYREFNCPAKDDTEQNWGNSSEDDEITVKLEAEEWLDGVNPFEQHDTNSNGIQMLLDAASRRSNKPNDSEDIDIDERQFEQFEAIQELINLKGEDTLLELLTEEDR